MASNFQRRILLLFSSALWWMPTLAVAAWLYPSYQSCISGYALPAATGNLAALAERGCSQASDETLPTRVRDVALCHARKVPAALGDADIGRIRSTCIAEPPTPACPVGQLFQDMRDRCETTCGRGKQYRPATDTCSNPCQELQIYIAREHRCVWPKPYFIVPKQDN